jgi:hypothetical protein
MKPSILAIWLLSISTLTAQVVSLVATAPVGGNGASETLTIRSNQVATVTHLYVPEEADFVGEPVRIPFLEVTLGTNTFLYKGNAFANVPGPATIKLSIANTNTFYQTLASTYCTIRIVDNPPQLSPSTAVVIPADSSGPVRITLESSPDLVNWNDALPGVYGSSTSNRFFRVRAVR